MSNVSSAYICMWTTGVHFYYVDVICFVVRRGNCQEIILFVKIVFILLIISGIMQVIYISCGVCFLCHSALYSRIITTKSLPFCVTVFVMSLTNLLVLVPQLCDCSCCVISRILDPALLQLQKHTDIGANDLTRSSGLWSQRRLPDVTCVRSWRLCEINPAIIFWMQDVNIWCL